MSSAGKQAKRWVSDSVLTILGWSEPQCDVVRERPENAKTEKESREVKGRFPTTTQTRNTRPSSGHLILALGCNMERLLLRRRDFGCWDNEIFVVKTTRSLLSIKRHFCCYDNDISVVNTTRPLLSIQRHFCCYDNNISVVNTRSLLSIQRHFCCHDYEIAITMTTFFFLLERNSILEKKLLYKTFPSDHIFQ